MHPMANHIAVEGQATSYSGNLGYGWDQTPAVQSTCHNRDVTPLAHPALPAHPDATCSTNNPAQALPAASYPRQVYTGKLVSARHQRPHGEALPSLRDMAYHLAPLAPCLGRIRLFTCPCVPRLWIGRLGIGCMARWPTAAPNPQPARAHSTRKE